MIGLILATASHRYILMVAFSLAGLYVGSVSALKRLGVYKAKDQRSE